ncbi:hypothetical protein EV701_120131 [Chthoniobacter flavus]|uniref:hypothetical protein n=1 Tax=Chthoniobacter flavus TaxID=191863 RepID=UPI0010F31C94|nr:hypothetical protein [Chthoniobacter flavus]TCO87832.1 hypothetical protein EV701_120131 [Chthoniobacter flavus]
MLNGADAAAAAQQGRVAAAKLVGTRLGWGAAAGAGFETVVRPAFDGLLHTAADVAGISHDDFQNPTVQSILTSAVLGAALSGEGQGGDNARAAALFEKYTRATAAGVPIEQVLSASELKDLNGLAPNLAQMMQEGGRQLRKDPSRFQIALRRMWPAANRPAAETTSPQGGAVSPAPSANTPPANPAPWGEVTDAHRGLPVETRDGRTGTLEAGPLPDTPNPNVAIRDAAGKLQTVPQAETRLAGSAGGDAPSPDGAAPAPNTPANPNTPATSNTPANPGPWGGVTDAHRGLPVETQDGRTGTLEAGPLPNTPNPNVAIRDAQGKLQTVPQAETRLAGSAGGDAPSPDGGAPAPNTPANPNTPPPNPARWGEVTDAHRGLPIETQDGRTGTLVVGPLPDTPNPNVAIRDAAGKLQTVPQAETRLAGSAGGDASKPGSASANGGGEGTSNDATKSMGAGSGGLPPFKPMSSKDRFNLEFFIGNKRADMDARYSNLGITPTEHANGRFAVDIDSDGNITPNLPNDVLFKKALRRSGGDLDAALAYVEQAHEEEYYHTIELLKMKKDWQQRGGKASGYDFIEYTNEKDRELAEDVVKHIENLPSEERGKAIHDVATLLRNYDGATYEGHADLKIWQDLQSDTQTRQAFGGEAVRQVAQHMNEKANTETGHLEFIDPSEHRARTRFYNRMALQVPAEEFGPQFADRVRRVAAEAKARKPIVP